MGCTLRVVRMQSGLLSMGAQGVEWAAAPHEALDKGDEVWHWNRDDESEIPPKKGWLNDYEDYVYSGLIMPLVMLNPRSPACETGRYAISLILQALRAACACSCSFAPLELGESAGGYRASAEVVLTVWLLAMCHGAIVNVAAANRPHNLSKQHRGILLFHLIFYFVLLSLCYSEIKILGQEDERMRSIKKFVTISISSVRTWKLMRSVKRQQC